MRHGKKRLNCFLVLASIAITQPEMLGSRMSTTLRGTLVRTATGNWGSRSPTLTTHRELYLCLQAKKELERSSGVPKTEPQPQPQAQPEVEGRRKVVSVRKQVKRPARPAKQQQSRFANFQARAPTAPAAPARQPQVFQATVRQPQPVQQVRQPQPVQRQQVRQPQQPSAPAVGSDPRFAGLRFQFQIQAPEFNYNNNFAENSYAFSSPLYSTTAQGGSYSYSATYWLLQSPARDTWYLTLHVLSSSSLIQPRYSTRIAIQ